MWEVQDTTQCSVDRGESTIKGTLSDEKEGEGGFNNQSNEKENELG